LANGHGSSSDLRGGSKAMRTAEIETSGRIVLRCEGCGEGLVLFGLEEAWRSERRTAFGCACG